MGKPRRVLVCGDSVALAGIATSLALDPNCQVAHHGLPICDEVLRNLQPDVILFDLDAVPPAFVYTASRSLRGVLLIGIDLETNRALLWAEQQAEGMCSQDLMDVIHSSGSVLPNTDASK
jgi:hypothetical protein